MKMLHVLYLHVPVIPQSLPNAPYMLEEVVNSVSEESSSSVKLQLLSAVMKMFFKRPPEVQEMLGRLLEHSIGKLILLEMYSSSKPSPYFYHMYVCVHVRIQYTCTVYSSVMCVLIVTCALNMIWSYSAMPAWAGTWIASLMP